MLRRNYNIVFLAFFLLALYNLPVHAQLKIKGTVYDRSTVFPLPYVSVLTNSGKGTMTDSNGNYYIELNKTDSIWFSYLEKPTKKFGANEITDPDQFNIAIFVDATALPAVKVKNRDYRLDSFQNRIDYARGFNYRKPNFKSVVPVVGLTFLVDIDELIRVFQYKKKKNALDFQRRLIEQEREKFIDHRFTKTLVTSITGLTGIERDSFMIQYRPSYAFTQTALDYTFQSYIKESFLKFRAKSPVKKLDE